MITSRQRDILQKIIDEYICLAQPVSSQSLEKKYKFGIRPATIRIEMKKLTNQGYLYQPHTSAGRIPTDKGYRFFVDELFEKKLDSIKRELEIDWEREIRDSLKLTQLITKFLASQSSNLALSYLAEERILWKEGWKDVLQEPEFAETGYAFQFAKMLDDFEKNIEHLFSHFSSETQVYIGEENPISKNKDFSLITSKFILPDNEGLLAILGPKRMSYSKNINLMNSIIKSLK